MPYWDFTQEHDRADDQEPYIFKTGLGGYGDPDDEWTVNEYSWDVTREQYWVPEFCTAKEDEFPICTLKRSYDEMFYEPSAKKVGDAIAEFTTFKDFGEWYTDKMNLPFRFLSHSYDPIWYLFHSMVSYHQAIWTDCHDYDLIDPDDLDDYPDAYQRFCIDGVDERCAEFPISVGLDDKMFFGGDLAARPWAWIHKNDLTVRKAYHFPRWNIIYELGNGDGFWKDSGLNEWCGDNLNGEWFHLNKEIRSHERDENEDILVKDKVHIERGDSKDFVVLSGNLYVVAAVLVIGAVFGLVAFMIKGSQTGKSLLYSTSQQAEYGTV